MTQDTNHTDQFIVVIEGIYPQEPITTSEEDASEVLSHTLDILPDSPVEVWRINKGDGTFRDVTEDVARTAFGTWDQNADADARMPYVYDILRFERTPRYDNREHRTYTTSNGSLAAGGCRG